MVEVVKKHGNFCRVSGRSSLERHYPFPDYVTKLINLNSFRQHLNDIHGFLIKLNQQLTAANRVDYFLEDFQVTDLFLSFEYQC